MQSKLFKYDFRSLFRREEGQSDSVSAPPLTKCGALDLRAQDPSVKRDRSAHRRSTWLYEDMLN